MCSSDLKFLRILKKHPTNSSLEAKRSGKTTKVSYFLLCLHLCLKLILISSRSHFLVNCGGIMTVANDINCSGNIIMISLNNDNQRLGYQSFISNTTGIQNTAYGSHALQFNTTGNLNTCKALKHEWKPSLIPAV